MVEYGFTAEAIDRVKGVFGQSSSAPGTPGPEVVVDAFVRLIETPAERPFRTVPTPAIQELLQPYNVFSAAIRDTIAQVFKVPELTVFQSAASEGVKRVGKIPA